jgi:hypothetical protein
VLDDAGIVQVQSLRLLQTRVVQTTPVLWGEGYTVEFDFNQVIQRGANMVVKLNGNVLSEAEVDGFGIQFQLTKLTLTINIIPVAAHFDALAMHTIEVTDIVEVRDNTSTIDVDLEVTPENPITVPEIGINVGWTHDMAMAVYGYGSYNTLDGVYVFTYEAGHVIDIYVGPLPVYASFVYAYDQNGSQITLTSSDNTTWRLTTPSSGGPYTYTVFLSVGADDTSGQFQGSIYRLGFNPI